MHPDVVRSYGRVEQEIQQERAAALGRIGRTLPELLDQLAGLRHRHGTAHGDERKRILAEYTDLRERALSYRWYLEVQRESVGLRRHERIDELYPVPPLLD